MIFYTNLLTCVDSSLHIQKRNSKLSSHVLTNLELQQTVIPTDIHNNGTATMIHTCCVVYEARNQIMHVNCHDVQNQKHNEYKRDECSSSELRGICTLFESVTKHIARRQVCWQRRNLCNLCMHSKQSVYSRIQEGIKFHPVWQKMSLHIQHCAKNRLLTSQWQSIHPTVEYKEKYTLIQYNTINRSETWPTQSLHQPT